jgi:hypothetical protein
LIANVERSLADGTTATGASISPYHHLIGACPLGDSSISADHGDAAVGVWFNKY